MNRRALLVFGISLLLAFLLVTYLRKDTPKLQHLIGYTMGSIQYNVKYIGVPVEELKEEIERELIAVNQSLSTYIDDSEISSLNKNGALKFSSSYFFPVLRRSSEIFVKTEGAFDPTVGPLIQAWGFGPNKQLPNLDSSQVDSLKAITGFQQVTFDDQEVTLPPNYQLDFSAIAKGYAVDVIAELLERRAIENYMVEIGGEVRCSGVNAEGKSWSLGIEDPTVAKDEHRLLAVVRLKNKALATSGNYRNYFEKEGRIYAHIIDPRTGYTANHSLLSASVFDEDCMSADAYATAFMVLGLDESKRIIEMEKLDAMLIYQDEAGTLKSFVSEGIKPFLELNQAN